MLHRRIFIFRVKQLKPKQVLMPKLCDSKEQLVQVLVLPELNDPNPQPEAKMLLFIDGFLAMNDCTKAKDPTLCYRKTRMLLINLAGAL